MKKQRKTNYCRAIIICHGKSELILFSRLKSILRLPISIESNEKGKSSVKIQGIESFFKRGEFNEKKSFCKKFFQEEYSDLRKQKKFQILLNQLKIFIVMDIDDATDDQVNRYKNCEYFKVKWLKHCCIPIYNDPDLEKTISEIGYKTPNTKNNKATFYQRLASSLETENDIKELQEKLKKCNCTNMERVMQYLLSI